MMGGLVCIAVTRRLSIRLSVSLDAMSIFGWRRLQLHIIRVFLPIFLDLIYSLSFFIIYLFLPFSSCFVCLLFSFFKSSSWNLLSLFCLRFLSGSVFRVAMGFSLTIGY